MDLFDWQDYNDIVVPENADRRGVYVLLSKKKPSKNAKGFLMTTNFYFEDWHDGQKLWIKFIKKGIK